MKRILIGFYKNQRLEKRVKRSNLTMIIVIILCLLISSVLCSSFAVVHTLDHSLEETAIISAKTVEKELNNYMRLIAEIANNDVIMDKNRSMDDKMLVINEFVQRNQFESAIYIDADGMTSLGVDFSTRQYVIDCKRDLKPYVSDVFQAVGTDNAMSVVFIAPIVVNGEYTGAVATVVNAEILSDLVKEIQVGDNGAALILSSDGVYYADHDYEKVTNQVNIMEENKSNKELISIVNRMRSGENGSGSYKIDQNYKRVAYSPIEGTYGWSICITASTNEFLQPILYVIIVSILLGLIFVFVSIDITRRITKSIVDPMNQIARRMEQLSEGDLHSPLPECEIQDEIYDFMRTIDTTIGKFKKIISDITQKLSAMEQCNFAVEFDQDYSGDFAPIQDSFVNFTGIMKKTLVQIEEASAKVTSGTNELSEAANSLADGAAEQNSKIEEVLSHIERMNDMIEEQTQSSSAENKKMSVMRAEIAENSKIQVKKLLDAMEEITRSSNQIQGIIQAIDEISSQTNLLALNASIEAARAGEQGKGFAVVASEIGKLANQSSTAVNETRQLIQISVSSVENGTVIVESMQGHFREVLESISEIVQYINGMAEQYEVQSEQFSYINETMKQIADVVELNLATAEETAATSVELESQSTMLKKQISVFEF